MNYNFRGLLISEDYFLNSIFLSSGDIGYRDFDDRPPDITPVGGIPNLKVYFKYFESGLRGNIRLKCDFLMVHLRRNFLLARIMDNNLARPCSKE